MNSDLFYKVILCTPQVTRSNETLLKILYTSLLDLPLEVYHRPDMLKFRLLGPKADIISVVLAANSVRELKAILPLQPLLDGIPVLMLVKNVNAEGLALAHRFLPKLLICAGDDLQNVAQVIINLYKNRKNKE